MIVITSPGESDGRLTRYPEEICSLAVDARSWLASRLFRNSSVTAENARIIACAPGVLTRLASSECQAFRSPLEKPELWLYKTVEKPSIEPLPHPTKRRKCRSACSWPGPATGPASDSNCRQSRSHPQP